MFKRHKILLGSFLYAPKAPSRTEFMKWIFLLKHETCLHSDRTFYDFVPYKYGPFSFMIYHDLEELVRDGYLNGEGYCLSSHLRNDARALVDSLPKKVRQAIRSIVEQYATLSQSKLIKYVYTKYPWFAERSDLVGKSTDSNSNIKTEVIYTAGYEGESIDLFLQKLLKAGIKRVVDVRNNPVSRKYGFSKSSLCRLCGNLGIEYVHLPDLGIPPSYRTSLNTFDDYQNLLNRYDRFFLPKKRTARKEASQLIQEQPSALVCFEADVRCCHRGRLAQVIATDTGMQVVHL